LEGTEPTITYGDRLLSEFETDLISWFSGNKFDEIFYSNGRKPFTTDREIQVKLPTVLLDQTITVTASEDFPQVKTLSPFIGVASFASTIIPEVIINTSLNVISSEIKEYVVNTQSFANLSMEFYTSIVTMESEIRSTEIDINLLQNVSSSITGKYEIDIILGLDKYEDTQIEVLRAESIAKYEEQFFTDRIAIGAAGFINGKRFTTAKNLKIDQFRDDLISSLQDYKFKDSYRDDTVRRNDIIQGTTTIVESTYGDFTLSRLETEAINNYASVLFSDLSGQKIYAVGSNTNYEAEYKVGDYFIVRDEKFIIKAISNSEFLELNVSSAQNHNDVFAYKEYFV
jgi:hypothetical protein